MLQIYQTNDPTRSASDWKDWKWQQRNAIRTTADLAARFRGLDAGELRRIERNMETRRLQITPYCLSLVQLSEDRRAPLPDDPIWLQVVPSWEPEADADGHDSYDGETENWELSHEMVTPIAQHKYDNRIIVRLSNSCLSYCQFCYEALRTIAKDSNKAAFKREHWNATLDYVRKNPQIQEVILSGGEPLLLGDDQLDQVLSDLNSLGRQILIRIHSRALTFNPFRVTDELVAVLAKHRVAAIGVHVTCMRELTDEFRRAAQALSRAVPILFANIPLLGGINDTVPAMERLCMSLYGAGVVPHYLYHFMPYSPGATVFRTPVQRGVEIIRHLKRRISNLAVPEFVLPHHSGKHTMPLLAEGETPPQRTIDDNGQPVIRYVNWKGDVVDYPETAR
jgi:lysine 2,3-aminomutase